MKRRWYIGFSILSSLALVLSACNANTNDMNHNNMDHSKMNHDMNPSSQGKAMIHMGSENKQAIQGLESLDTKNVTRINQEDPVKVAVQISQKVWPATHEANRPGTVLLGILGDWKTNLPAVTLIHHPNNGPFLYAEKNKIPASTMQELLRLQPKGSKSNQGIQVVLVGAFDSSVKKELEAKGLKVDQIQSSGPAEMSRDLDAYYSKASGAQPDGVIVGSMDAPEYTLPAANWIAHMPEPLLYVNKDNIPTATEEALKKRNNKANIYLLGPESVVSKQTEDKLKKYGKVVRISGETPEANAIAFAKFKDTKTQFGWGITKPGHGFTFLSANQMEIAIPSAAFAHLGKHAPMLLLQGKELSEPIKQYLMSVKPTFTNDPTVGPYNHAYMIGTESTIPYTTQGVIDELLEIAPQSGNGHGGH